MKRALRYCLLVGSACLAMAVGSCGSRQDALTVWHTESDPGTQRIFEEIGQQFKAETGVDVVYRYVKWGDLSGGLAQAIREDPKHRLPDIAHLEPYMAYSLYRQGWLEDISDVVTDLQGKHVGGIAQEVVDLQRFDGKYYGIAQHVGISLILFRSDILAACGVAPPRTWPDFFAACKELQTMKGSEYYPIAIPGSSPFFMECIFSEYLNSSGGQVFDDRGLPSLGDPKTVRALDIFAKMKPYVTRDYERMEYQDQFQKLISGDAAFVMFAGARALLTFEKQDSLSASPTKYSVLEPPMFIEDGKERTSYTSIDCEPFVIMKRGGDVTLAKKWLRVFYEPKNYVKFCETVPIQLIPIFSDLRPEYERNATIARWRPWYETALRMIDSGRVQPYFMQRGQRGDLDFLLAVYDSGTIYGLIKDVLKNGTLEPAAREKAEEHLLEIIRRKSEVVTVPGN